MELNKFNDENQLSFISKDLKAKAFPLSKVTEAELILKVAKFLVTNHMSFESGPKVLEFIKEISSCYDPILIQKTHTSRTTITDVIRYGIGYTLQSGIYNHLRQSKFSIMFDTTSDVFGGKYLGILVRYLNSYKGKIATKLLATLEIKGDTTGETLYKTIRGLFSEHDPAILNNLVALCSDNGSNCISSKDAGCANRFIAEFPGLVDISDFATVTIWSVYKV